MNALVRAVEATHLHHLLGLLRAKAIFDGAEHSLQATEESLASELFAPNARVRAIVAMLDGRAVGMATYFQTFSSFLVKPGIWLDDLYVEEAYRKHGIGKDLLTWLCNEAASSGCARIDWIVASDNANGRAFYERMGATIFETVRLARLDQQAISNIVRGA